MRNHVPLLACLLIAAPALAAAPLERQEQRARIFLAPDSAHPEFTIRCVRTEGAKSCRFLAPDGAIVAEEDIEFDSDFALRSLRFKQLQTGAEGWIRREGGKLRFHYAQDGDVEDEEEEVRGAVPPNMLPEIVIRRWAELERGEDLSVRIALVDRAESVGLKLSLRREPEADGSRRVVGKPSALFPSLVVKPVRLYFDARGTRLLALHGPVPPRVREDGEWKDPGYLWLRPEAR